MLQIGNKKALGLSELSSVGLKVAIKEAPSPFLAVCVTYFKEGTFPMKWKQQRLVLLSRGKKPTEKPSSYRPLYMLDIAREIMERIVRQKIETAIDSLLVSNQYGFRGGRSTWLST